MQMTSKVPVSADLMERLQRDAVQLLQLKQRPAVLYDRTLRNPYSDVHIVRIDPGNLNVQVYIKIPHAGPSSLHLMQTRLAAEFGIMQQLHSKTSAATDGSCPVATPLGYYPEHLALATLKAASQTLRQHYRSAARLVYNRRSRELLLRETVNCGVWLKKFQQYTACGTSAFDDKQLIAYVQIRLDRLMEKAGLGFSRSLAEKIVAQITSLSRSIAPETHCVAGRHNDFASHNILAEDGKIWAIDFSMYDTGSSAYDPAYFWLELEMLKIDPSYSAPFLSLLQNAFLQAYGSISIDSPAFRLARCQYSLNRILTFHSDARLPTPGTLYRRAAVKACMAWVVQFAHP